MFSNKRVIEDMDLVSTCMCTQMQMYAHANTYRHIYPEMLAPYPPFQYLCLRNLKLVAFTKCWVRTITFTVAIQSNNTKLSDQFRILARNLLLLLAQTFTLKVCLLLLLKRL